MLDRKFILENVELVKRNCANRGVEVDVNRFVVLEHARKAKQVRLDERNRKANELARSIAEAADEAQREALKAEGRRLRKLAAEAREELDMITEELDALARCVPNLSHPDAPVGADETANRELFQGKTPRPQFDFQPRDHVELAEKLDLIDFEGGARVAGHGFYFLKNEMVLLELALQRYALDVLLAEGFSPTATPDLARNEILEGIGFIPRGPETQIYSIENTDLSLVATAEITLGGLLAGQTLDAPQLPIKLCGLSHCFRTEAGAHGRAARGLFRVHQFTKVEMFAFTLPEQSDAMLDYLRDVQCRLFDGLGVPFRVVDTCTGDLGGPAYRKYDLEAWMPGRGDYGEITSTSNCTDYQARRLNIRYKVKGEKGTRFVHTLNGTAVAVSRAAIAVLENYQQADGSVLIPEVLRPLVGRERIEPRQS
jgi:seryl-tRNA synthetase